MLEAYRCFHQAAILGHGLAKYNLGIMNFNGQGVPKNRNEAYHWFRQSARTGNEGAKKVLRSIRVLRQMDKSITENSDGGIEFNHKLLEDLDEVQQFWYAKTVIAMVVADQHSELHERAFLHSALGLLKDNVGVQKLEEAILFGIIPEIESIEISLEKTRNSIKEI